MRRERRVGKIRMIYALEMGFILLNKRNTLIISVPIRCAAEGIGRSTMHIVFSIRTCKSKSLCTNVGGI